MATPGPSFPEVDLDASAPTTTYHKVVLTVTSKQNGQPWASQVTTYEHASNAIVSIITGQIANLGAKLGPKGTKPRNDNFDLNIKLEVDGQVVTNPPADWNGVSREFVLGAERGLLEMWMGMNEDSAKTNKAHGKI
jgi:hypothetical protein